MKLCIVCLLVIFACASAQDGNSRGILETLVDDVNNFFDKISNAFYKAFKGTAKQIDNWGNGLRPNRTNSRTSTSTTAPTQTSTPTTTKAPAR